MYVGGHITVAGLSIAERLVVFVPLVPLIQGERFAADKAKD
jgi:hypothetical protein